MAYNTEHSNRLTSHAKQLKYKHVILSQGTVEVKLSIPSEFWEMANNVHQEFQLKYAASNLPDTAEEGSSDLDENITAMKLTSNFMRFIVDSEQIEDASPTYYILEAVFHHFNNVFIKDGEIHSVTQSMPYAERRGIIKSYMNAYTIIINNINRDINIPFPLPQSALLKASASGEANIFAIFSGQGSSERYFDELQEIFDIYGVMAYPFISHISRVLKSLSLRPEVRSIHSKEFDILGWLEVPESSPENNYLSNISVSSPIVAAIQLTHYYIAMKLLGINPNQLLGHFSGMTGHSQGIMTAVAVSSSKDIESFFINSQKILTVLFWCGFRAQKAYPPVILNPSIIEDSISHDEGKPSYMLSINNLSVSQVEAHIKRANHHLVDQKKIYIGLVNGPKSVVCVGHPQSLYGLNLILREIKPPKELDQSRIPFSDRKPTFSSRFLPISGPYHSGYFLNTVDLILEDLASDGVHISGSELILPVNATDDGRNLQLSPNLISDLVQLVLIKPVFWKLATDFKSPTHIIDFGPGGKSGIGSLTYRNKMGTGVRVILAGTLGGLTSHPDIAFKAELFNTDINSVNYGIDWAKRFQPKLFKLPETESIIIDTKMSQLLGKPPLMVAGMTPSTGSLKFVSAVINAGFHVELAGGSHHSKLAFRSKIDDLIKNIQPGEGITANLIILDISQWKFQFPLILEMRQEGYPIEGLCIGGGVPSPGLAKKIMTQVKKAGLRHISFKPSTVSSIDQIVSIASLNPDFPIILQWTGGRSGGHHSFDDFHQPIIETYPHIRNQSNIVLVAGSGFGSAEDSYPYLTGDWSVKFGYPPMPYNGILFGSRMMVAEESQADDLVKQAIIDAPGTDDDKWEKTYHKETGGILTVKSEMGEPIHMVATRGIKFWKEMDNLVFKVPQNQRLAILEANRDYILSKLNSDFQKPWFCCKNDGKLVDLKDMSYYEVLLRLLDLTYIRCQGRWVDDTFCQLFGDFMTRIETKFITKSQPSLIQDYRQIQNPYEFVTSFLDSYPSAYYQLMTTNDVQYFLLMCQRQNMKPVPFIPILDKNFEYWMKKDSLWYSEDLSAIPDNDPQRVAILHGPIAAKYSTKLNIPSKEILDTINNDLITMLSARYYSKLNIPAKGPLECVNYCGNSINIPKGVVKSFKTNNCLSYTINSDALPEEGQWLELICGAKNGCLYTVLTAKFIVQGSKYAENIVGKLFQPRPNQKVNINLGPNNSIESIKVFQKDKLAIVAKCLKEKVIEVTLLEHKDNTLIPLKFIFKCISKQSTHLVHESMEDRNDRIKEFYYKLWFESDNFDQLSNDIEQVFVSEDEELVREDITNFCQAVGNQEEIYINKGQKILYAPIDFAFIVGWKSIVKTIFPKFIDGDLLKMVHLSNGFTVLDYSSPLKAGDIVTTHTKIASVINTRYGKEVKVEAILKRDGKDVIQVESRFLFKGKFDDFNSTYSHTDEVPMTVILSKIQDIAIIQSKSWFLWENEHIILKPGVTLIFKISNQVKFKSTTIFSETLTTGKVFILMDNTKEVEVGSVLYSSAESYGNPVLEYLKRTGQHNNPLVPLKHDIHSTSTQNGYVSFSMQAPDNNYNYSLASKDFNPIHTNPYFAELAGLPNIITHGMWTSAATKAQIERFCSQGNPHQISYYKVNFEAMVFPGDKLTINLKHIGMKGGEKVIDVETINQHGTRVLKGLAQISQPKTCYVFTGQGPQEKGMGMALYSSSISAKNVWDKADAYYQNNYGFSILYVVQTDPKVLTVHFGGSKGQFIRSNYFKLTYYNKEDDGSIKKIPMFPEITEDTTSYTFSSPSGLLSSIIFAQPAITILAKANFEDLKSRGLIKKDSPYAGHSLGEYAALGCLGNFWSLEELSEIIFYRGLTMHLAGPRNNKNQSNFGMLAVNLTRLPSSFNESHLSYFIKAIQSCSDGLIEIANFNVEYHQYVVSGDIFNLEILTNVLDYISINGIDANNIIIAKDKFIRDNLITDIVLKILNTTHLKKGCHFSLKQGTATTPISGVDVPGHSSFFLSSVGPYRSYLMNKINPDKLLLSNLIDIYIPNLTAKPFSLSRKYFEEVLALTGSPPIAQILSEWPEDQHNNMDQQILGYALLVELLSYQMANPVRWIEVQDVLFIYYNVERFIEIGPAPILSNMAAKTLKNKHAISDKLNNIQRSILCITKNSNEINYFVENELPVPSKSVIPNIKAADDTPHIIPQKSTPIPRQVPAKSIKDEPFDATNILHVILAQKLKKELNQVSIYSSIKELAGGKSTLQNEILGDLEKEFGNNLPPKSEEIPLNDLGTFLKISFCGNLGKYTTSLISKMLSSKFPGGFNQTSARDYLSGEFGLGPLRVDAVLLLALLMEPSSRFMSETEAKTWLNNVAQEYAIKSGIELSKKGLTTDGAAENSNYAIDNFEFDLYKKEQKQFYNRQLQVLKQYTGIDKKLISAKRQEEGEKALAVQLQNEVDGFTFEHSEVYVQKIQPLFDSPKARVYDSYWNWSRQDALILYYSLLQNKEINEISINSARHLLNRADSALLDFINYNFIEKMTVTTTESRLKKNAQLKSFGQKLMAYMQKVINDPPLYQENFCPTAPSSKVLVSGEIKYSEVERVNVPDLTSYIMEMSNGSFLTRFLEPNIASQSLDTIIELSKDQYTRSESYSADIQTLRNEVTRALYYNQPESKLTDGRSYGSTSKNYTLSTTEINKDKLTSESQQLPFIFLKKKDPVRGWVYHKQSTSLYFQLLEDLVKNGVSFQNKNVLITGCGKNSIGSEVLIGLLSGGAKVIATTSNFTKSTTIYYESLYKHHGAKGAKLTVVPFNQGSKQDIDNLVNYIYGLKDEHGVGFDLDFIIPFGAVSDNEREIDSLDGVSEFAHRVMLTNVLRLLGAVKTKKQQLKYYTRPAHVLVPLSPNHGLFGGDGLYSESKIGLENLLNRWHSESWSPYLALVGTVIGWTRGTNLMLQNDLISQGLEKLGARTFSTKEMAFNIIGLMHPKLVALAQTQPIWADLGGGFQEFKDFKKIVEDLRKDINDNSTCQKAVVADNAIDFDIINGPLAYRSFHAKTINPQAKHDIIFPKLKEYSELKDIHYLQGMLDLDKVVVVTGFGEVGTYGSARTRWEIESYGELSLEGCIEMAWIMGYIKYNSGPLKSGNHYIGWVDCQSSEPVPDLDIKRRYETKILDHSGIRVIDPDAFGGFDPNHKLGLREIIIDHDLEPIEVTQEEAIQLKERHNNKILVISQSNNNLCTVQFLKGASIYIPKALRRDRLVAGQLPTGWCPLRYGVPKDIVAQIDRTTLFGLVSTVEALITAGVTDPYEFYKYVHVSEVGISMGSCLGGLDSLKKIYKDRFMEQPVQMDILQETMINSMSAWINMLLISSSGPVKVPVGACATSVMSLEIGLDSILSGKAKVVIVGGAEDLSEEISTEFGNMRATSNSIDEIYRGRVPSEMCRPATSTRAGFMESAGSGTQIIMSARLALDMGCPIYGIVALANTSLDKEGRSLPSPGQGILTTTKEVRGQLPSPLLDLGYRRSQIHQAQNEIKRWLEQEYYNLSQIKNLSTELYSEHVKFLATEAMRREKAFLRLMSSELYQNNPTISPLRGALAVYGLTVDDIGLVSFHGTGTKANDLNESELIDLKMTHLGRAKGNILPGVFQKYITGHSKAAAAAFMVNGVLQCLQSGIIPGNKNADNIEHKLKQFEFVLYPSQPIHTTGLKAGMVMSFGFGQVSGEVLIISPEYVLASLSEKDYEKYKERVDNRQKQAFRYFQDTLAGVVPMVQVKNQPPYTTDQEKKVYLNPMARAAKDKVSGTYIFDDLIKQSSQPISDNNAKLLMGKHIGTSGIGLDVQLIGMLDLKNGRGTELTSSETKYCEAQQDCDLWITKLLSIKGAVHKAIQSLSNTYPEKITSEWSSIPLKDIELDISSLPELKVDFHSRARHTTDSIGVKNINIILDQPSGGSYIVALAAIPH